MAINKDENAYFQVADYGSEFVSGPSELEQELSNKDGASVWG